MADLQKKTDEKKKLQNNDQNGFRRVRFPQGQGA